MTNEEFIIEIEARCPSSLYEHAKKLVAVYEASKLYDKNKMNGCHSDVCNQPIECTCGYHQFSLALKDLER